MVEYSSPNTNKPLHLGHLRNIFLGDAVSNILSAVGHKITRTQIINDRGIHICKSMKAWSLDGSNTTPTSQNMKGDKFVGAYYVAFDKQLKKETENLYKEWFDGQFNVSNEDTVALFNKLKQSLSQKVDDEKGQKGIETKMKALVTIAQTGRSP